MPRDMKTGSFLIALSCIVRSTRAHSIHTFTKRYSYNNNYTQGTIPQAFGYHTMEAFGNLSVQELLEYDAATLQALFEQGSLTSVNYVKCVLTQIKKENLEGWRLQALISVAPEELLLKTAAALDDERAAGSSRGQFHGVPIIMVVNKPITAGCKDID